MTTVFLSYAREDSATVRVIANQLASLEHDVFWDEDIRGGTNWRQELDARLARTQCVLVAWSRHSVASPAVRLEATEGLKKGVLLPVLLDDGAPPPEFADIQATDLRGWIGNERDPRWQALQQRVAEHAGRMAEASNSGSPFVNDVDDPSRAPAPAKPAGKAQVSKWQAVLEQQARTALSLSPAQQDAFEDITMIRTYDEQEFEREIRNLEGYGYRVVERRPGEAWLEGRKQFNWLVAGLLTLLLVFPLVLYVAAHLRRAQSRLYVVQVPR